MTKKMEELLLKELFLTFPADKSESLSGEIVESFESNYDSKESKRRFRSFLWNLRRGGREHMLQQLKEGLQSEDHDWNSKNVALLEVKRYDPKITAERDRSFKRYHKNIEDVPEGSYRCGRCKSKRIITVQKQTRSADEPMTCFHTCSECEKRWKS